MRKSARSTVAVCSLWLVATLAVCGDARGASGPGDSPNTVFPAPFAGAFYPIYNSGAGLWIEPTRLMPFEKVSAIFVAFGHAYPDLNAAVFDFEHGQPRQSDRLEQLVKIARDKNPRITILISLGWEQHDWNYIARDYAYRANRFVPSVIQFVRKNGLDGLDIDDEDIGPDRSSGNITQVAFDGVIADLRKAFDTASAQDKRPYYLTITPAGDNADTGGIYGTQVDKQNSKMFDLISIQYYWNLPGWGELFLGGLKSIDFPAKRIGIGVNTQRTNCNPYFPDPEHKELAGYFDWNMTFDSTCKDRSGQDFEFTRDIARRAGY